MRTQLTSSAVSAVVLVAVLCGGCSSQIAGRPSAPATAAPAPPAATTPAEEPATEGPTLAPGATPGLDDLNGDGQPDPTCANKDYGGGLVVRIPCNAADFANTPPQGTAFVPDSLLALPSVQLDLSAISGEAVQARTDSGQKLVILFITADTLFAVGSSAFSEPALVNFDAISALIQKNWPTAQIQVRGHTDATGTPAANQTLSDQRAKAVADYLGAHGLDRARISAVGLGQSMPLVQETDATGQQYNRRVEIAIRLP